MSRLARKTALRYIVDQYHVRAAQPATSHTWKILSKRLTELGFKQQV